MTFDQIFYAAFIIFIILWIGVYSVGIRQNNSNQSFTSTNTGTNDIDPQFPTLTINDPAVGGTGPGLILKDGQWRQTINIDVSTQSTFHDNGSI